MMIDKEKRKRKKKKGREKKKKKEREGEKKERETKYAFIMKETAASMDERVKNVCSNIPIYVSNT